jgi:predicted DNA-binding protein (MmcQ/YjbR family)
MIEAEFRALALSLPEAVEAPHFEATSFRVRGKIFATLGEGAGAVLKLPPHIQEAVVQSDADTAGPVAGYWGRQGWTRIDYGRMESARLADLLRLAWRQVAPKKLHAQSEVLGGGA